jgi:hypothetical protein
MKIKWLFHWLLLLSAALCITCALFFAALWFGTAGERELKQQMGLVRKALDSIRPCTTEFHWSESGKITVVVLGMVEEPEQDKAIHWMKERKAEGLFERFHQVKFFETDTWSSPRKLIRQAGL